VNRVITKITKTSKIFLVCTLFIGILNVIIFSSSSFNVNAQTGGESEMKEDLIK